MGHFDFLNMAFSQRPPFIPAVSARSATATSGTDGRMGRVCSQSGYTKTPALSWPKDVESQTFPWTEEGVEAVKAWLEQKLKERGTQPYFIPYPVQKAEQN